jgi:hypothetical protein
MRIEPPPSLAWATDTMPAATAAADPPLEPPAECCVFHGFRVGPNASGSLVGRMPSSGLFVRPRKEKPAARRRAVKYESSGSSQPASRRNRIPAYSGAPAMAPPRSFRSIGTPRNGPSGSFATRPRASSKKEAITALSPGFSFSMRAIAPSRSSWGVTSPRRTRSA